MNKLTQKDLTQWFNQQESFLPLTQSNQDMYDVHSPMTEDFFSLETDFDSHSIQVVEMV